MTAVKDSVHDHIAVTGVARELLETPPVQRLRRISQLGTVVLVYPSANHTRFEHSLGVYHLADRALDHLGIEGQQAERVRAAALLHDVGHCPYSHNVEELVYRETGKYHDEVADLVGSGAVVLVSGARVAVAQQDRIEQLIDQAGGQAAQLLAEARAYRWERPLQARGKAKRFSARVVAYKQAPRYYRMRQYLDVLSESLIQPRKIIMTAQAEAPPTIRLNLESARSGLESILGEGQQ